ncbi:MAG: hypothetical protein IH974_05865 [Myxococcales bacterium]|nr:hypothetical protein [Myxococcales bacterium]
MQLRNREFGAREVSDVGGFPYQTLVDRDRSGLVKPSLARKKGTKGDKGEKGQRRYSLNDCVAALIADTTQHIGLGDAVPEIVAMVQRGNREELRNAVIVCAYTKGQRHFMQNFFFSDKAHTATAALIEEWRADDRIISEATLEQLCMVVLKRIHAKYVQDSLAGTLLEAS